MALIVARVLAPDSKLATARALDPASATSTLGQLLGVRAHAPLQRCAQADRQMPEGHDGGAGLRT